MQLVELPVTALTPPPLDDPSDRALDADHRQMLDDDGKEREHEEDAEADPDDDPRRERLHVETARHQPVAAPAQWACLLTSCRWTRSMPAARPRCC